MIYLRAVPSFEKIFEILEGSERFIGIVELSKCLQYLDLLDLSSRESLKLAAGVEGKPIKFQTVSKSSRFSSLDSFFRENDIEGRRGLGRKRGLNVFCCINWWIVDWRACGGGNGVEEEQIRERRRTDIRKQGIGEREGLGKGHRGGVLNDVDLDLELTHLLQPPSSYPRRERPHNLPWWKS